MNTINLVDRPAMIGCDDLREWLLQQGFKCSVDSLGRDNGCNWYAYRRSAIAARECECNEGKRMQIVVRPFLYRDKTNSWESAEVDLAGEFNGIWFKLSAYSLKHEELHKRLPEIEANLVAAWNSMGQHHE